MKDFFSVISLIILFSSCVPSKEEMSASEQVTADSTRLANETQAKLSLQKIGHVQPVILDAEAQLALALIDESRYIAGLQAEKEEMNRLRKLTGKNSAARKNQIASQALVIQEMQKLLEVTQWRKAELEQLIKELTDDLANQENQ